MRGSPPKTRRRRRTPGARDLRARGELIAYFSAEFGLTEAFPIYAGGLGILAGDHLKSSSDLGLPLVGVGLFYKEGYFGQLLDPEGRQTEVYRRLDPEALPLSLAQMPDGSPPLVSVELEGRRVQLLIRLARVGRVPLYLLDSNIEENVEADRGVTDRLYSGGRRCRLKQEIVLGIGGLRALEKLGLRPTIRHINEGHAAFVSLEKVRQLVVEEGLSFEEAREVAAAGNVFTTHTPVPAGIDVFSEELLWKFFADYVPQIGITFEQFFALGRETGESGRGLFSMAVLAMRLSAQKNAVSRLHARVSRGLWRDVTPDLPLSEVPIDADHQRRAPGDLDGAGDGVLECIREARSGRSRAVLAAARGRAGAPGRPGARAPRGCGRARPERPDDRVCAALRHLQARDAASQGASAARLPPAPGRETRSVRFRRQGAPAGRDRQGVSGGDHAGSPGASLQGPVRLLPDYDMALARSLTAGCDVWLNTPERPREASGTSGMKAAMNGVLNLSVLDGWWDEAPREETGFSIGPAEDGAPDEVIASALYEALESHVLPLFYARDNAGLPQGWIDKMLASASTLGRAFSSDRMVTEYLEQCYVPGAARRRDLKEDNRARLRRLVAWKRRVADLWPGVRFLSCQALPEPAELAPGDTFQVEAALDLAGLTAQEVHVELFEGPLEPNGSLESGYAVPLELSSADGSGVVFRGEHSRPAHAGIGWALRVRPFHPDLAHLNETGLAIWSGARPREGTAYGS